TAEEDELGELVEAVCLTSPEPPSTETRRGSKGNKMTDNYDVENQGRPDPSPFVTTCLLEKPDIDKKVKRHSIHGMMEEENVIRPHQEMAQLSLDEKKFLLAVERGDVASTRRMLQRAQETDYININCVDPLGRSALLMAIDNENLEMVELLIEHKVETKDALLHAISEEFVEAVEVLLDHEETLHREGELHSWEALPPDTATFTPDITPLILAAHRDNYEIIKILLDRGATLPMPHDVSVSTVSGKRKRVVVSSDMEVNAIKHMDQERTIKNVASDLGVGELAVGLPWPPVVAAHDRKVLGQALHSRRGYWLYRKTVLIASIQFCPSYPTVPFKVCGR
ncbi:hypothetical protein Cfor_06946, partial [Coptotermes formosanus]